MNRAWSPALACLGAVAACSTTPVQPEPTYELVDSFEYSLDLRVDGIVESTDTELFEDYVYEAGPDVPLSNSLLQLTPDSTSATAFGSVEPLEFSAGTQVNTGLRADAEVTSWTDLRMNLRRCGYPVATPFRVVVTMAPATGAAATGDFAGLDGAGELTIQMITRSRSGEARWRTSGESSADIEEDNEYQWEWTDRFDAASDDDVNFFDGFSGLDATVDSPEMLVASDGCVEIIGHLSIGSRVHTPQSGAVAVSGSYTLSIMIET